MSLFQLTIFFIVRTNGDREVVLLYRLSLICYLLNKHEVILDLVMS